MNTHYTTLHDTLMQLEIPLPVAEVHGVLCGLLCVQPSGGAKSRWFVEVLEAAGVAPEAIAAQASQIKQLDEWFTETLTAMNDSDMTFTPCLPEDSTPTAERMQALADFCAGFTYGIGLSGKQAASQTLPADTRDIINDFQAINAADAIDEADEHGEVLTHEKQEALFAEVLEYVRVGVILILEELRPVTPTQQESLT